jgi:hypothetical protein
VQRASGTNSYSVLSDIYSIELVRDYNIRRLEMPNFVVKLCGPAKDRKADASLILNIHGHCRCLVTRDVMFVLGSLSLTLMSIIPDYSKSKPAFFTSATRAVISEDGNLRSLERFGPRLTSQSELLDPESHPSYRCWRSKFFCPFLTVSWFSPKTTSSTGTILIEQLLTLPLPRGVGLDGT